MDQLNSKRKGLNDILDNYKKLISLRLHQSNKYKIE